MKNFKSFALAAFSFILVAVASCSSSDSTPVGKYVSQINNVTNQIKKCDSMSELTGILENADINTDILNENKDYRLTSDDKKAIASSFTDFTVIIIEKGYELSGAGLDKKMINNICDRLKSKISAAISDALQNCDTLDEVESALDTIDVNRIQQEIFSELLF